MRFAEAEAEALIRSQGLVAALADALVEHGSLDGRQVDKLINDATGRDAGGAAQAPPAKFEKITT